MASSAAPADTALLLIDFQRGFVDGGWAQRYGAAQAARGVGAACAVFWDTACFGLRPRPPRALSGSTRK